MQDIMIRIETDDFDAWKTQHYVHAENRATFGITDGPAYQDIDNPNAALFHIKTEDMDRAMQWFKSDTLAYEIEVKWRSGRVSRLAKAAANRLYEISESGAAATAPSTKNQEPLFESATSLLSGHTHVDSAFDDYARQPLVLKSVVDQIEAGNRSISSVMIESYLKPGNQPMPKDLSTLTYGVSITDSCIGWETTEQTLREAHARLKACGGRRLS